MDTERKDTEKSPKGFRPSEEARPREGLVKYLGNNIVIEFIGSVAISGIVGALADRAFGTAPWLTLLMILLGFGAGVTTAWRALKETETKE